MQYKQAILVRADLKLPKGKMAAQVAHASVESAMKCDRKMVGAWRASGSKKVVLRVGGLEELQQHQSLASSAGIKTAVITDAGKTVIAPGTVTCLGVGPDEEEKIDKVTGSLKLV